MSIQWEIEWHTPTHQGIVKDFLFNDEEDAREVARDLEHANDGVTYVAVKR